MAKPELLTIQNGGFARGADAFENDGLILAEITGHCDRKTNIAHYNNYYIVDFNTRLSWLWGGLPAHEAVTSVFELAFMRNATLVKSSYIGYAVGTGATAFDLDGGTDTTIVASITRVGADGISTEGNHTVTMNDANLEFESTSNVEFTRDAVMKVYFTRNDSATAGFDPYIQAKYVFKEEHSF
jgi:hypothetical protein